ncbi:MAG: 23S rRNA (guanosine(2251)-2'-O)-methyltransferase RlmB [Actinobacteria bacterium]|nr:23S rRNA (guanosine(2251)-2'-O)-methyltransferase RlmB [Actinomycetota bacterium]
MAGNSQRRGATRKPGAKKAPSVGSGGNSRRALKGRGPTPKAEDREYHAAHKRKAAPAAGGSGGAPNGGGAPAGRPAAGRPAAGRPAAGRPTGGRPPAGRATGGRAPGRGSTKVASARGGSVTELVSGRNSVLEALRAGVPVSAVYVASRIESDDRTREILALASATRAPLMEVGRGELDRMTEGSVHQGVALAVPPYTYAEADDLLDAAAAAGVPPLIVALDGVTDPRNLGAVIRSAGAFGAHGVLVPTRRSAGVTAAAWKVSAGAIARVPVARATNLARTLAELRRSGVFVVGLAGDGDTVIGEVPFVSDPLVLVAGSEGKGLSRLVREQCDAIAAIPISGGVESLNAGVAAGIALYEVARQRA